MIIFIEIPKNLWKPKFDKVAWYKVNAQKSILCLYVSNKQLKIKSKATMAFKNMKYLGINLTKYMQGMYTENYKTY